MTLYSYKPDGIVIIKDFFRKCEADVRRSLVVNGQLSAGKGYRH